MSVLYKRGTWRKIVGYNYLTGYSGCKTGTGSYELSLSCGHTKYVKASKRPKNGFAFCRECRPQAKEERSCRFCGCTDRHACAGGCYWVELDLCSRCAPGAAEAEEGG